VDQAVKTALINLKAKPAPAGTMPVVVGSGWPGVLLHEAIGHGLEGDFNRKGSSAFSGRIGQRVASDACTVVDSGILPGQVDITNGKFVFSANEAYLIENGKITTPVKGATLIGDGPTVLTRVSMVGSDLAFDQGLGVCGKDGQSVPVGIGQPTLRVDELTVGGTRL